MGKQQKIQAGCICGEVTVIARTTLRKNGYVVWQCLCSCGNTFYADSRCLSRGTVHDCGCGCSKNSNAKTLVGMRFGRLTVVSFNKKAHGKNYWNCVCDCGNTTTVAQSLLKSGKTKSCGCLRKEQTQKNAGHVNGSSTVLVKRFSEKPSKANQSGCSGVYFNKRTGKWSAQITFKGKTRYLGTFANKEDAVAARKQAESVFDRYLQETNTTLSYERECACTTAQSPALTQKG